MQTSLPPSRVVPVAALEQFTVEALRRLGVTTADAQTTADALVIADTWGTFTHGTKLLVGYLRRLRGGGIRTDVRPAVLSDGPAWAIVDGGSALGQVIGTFAMETAVNKARSAGISYVGVRNSNHFGAAGYYPWLAARQGLLGVAMCNDMPSVVAPGARRAVTGTNPIAFALPCGDRPPVLLDIAISTVAGGKVYVARQLGKPIAPDWLIDSAGRPTTDGSLYPDHAALAPMGGHKGYGLALLVEALSGVLSGAAVTWQVGSWIWGDTSKPTGHGAAFLAIDVAAMAPGDEFRRRMRALIDEIHATPAAAGSDGVLLPGEREWRNRERALAEGIPLPPDVVAALTSAAEEAGIAPPWQDDAPR